MLQAASERAIVLNADFESGSLARRVADQARAATWHAVRTFLMLALLGALVFGLVVGWVAFVIASNGSTERGLVAAISCGTVGGLLGVMPAVKITMILVPARVIRQSNIGGLVFNRLFDVALGVTDRSPGGLAKWTQAVHGLTFSEAKLLLFDASIVAGEQSMISQLPKGRRWLVARVQRTLFWIVARVVLWKLRVRIGRHGRVDLLALRDSLAGVIDRIVIEWIEVKLRFPGDPAHSRYSADSDDDRFDRAPAADLTAAGRSR